MKSRIPLLLAAALLAAALLPAEARPMDRQQAPKAWDDPVPEGFEPGLSAATGVLCVKQCPGDMSPCDPPSYKVADGRCETQWN